MPAPRTGRLLVGILLIALGIGWMLEALDVIDLPWDVFLPIALIAVGAVLVINARTGAGQAGLIGLGVVLTVLLFFGSLISFPFAGGVGERTETPTTLEEAQERFELGIGQLTVDLTELPTTVGAQPSLIRARVGIGQLVVLVPEGVAVRVEAKASLGSAKVFEQEEGGLDVDLVSEPGSVHPAYDLRLSVGLGEVRVDRA